MASLAGIRSAAFFEGPLQKAVHRFKYRRDAILADNLAVLMIAAGSDNLPAGSLVVLAFNNMDDVKAWWNSPAYQAIIPLREKSTKTRAYAVQGVPPS